MKRLWNSAVAWTSAEWNGSEGGERVALVIGAVVVTVVAYGLLVNGFTAVAGLF